ncbi:MAG: hypothetical protein R2822_06100 [Spirosomataceae bacterium]
MQLYGRFQALASDIGANGADFKPTNQQREVYAVLNERLQNVQNKYDSVIKPNWVKLSPSSPKKAGSLGGVK